MKKLRSDSTFAKLTLEQLAEVNELLATGCGYAEAQAALAAMGYDASITAISEYYHNHVLPARWRKQQRLAVQLSGVDAKGLDEATLNATKQTLMELAITPGSDPKLFKMLYQLTLKARAQDVSERRMDLLEREAELAAQTRAALQNTGMTDEEKNNRVREIFGLI